MLQVPFYKNLNDNSHCFQACLKMLLKYTFPKVSYSFVTLDRLTNHRPFYWTWSTAGLLFLAKKGFEIMSIENFDYKQFVRFGEEYLRMIWAEEVFETQKQYSNFQKERVLAKKFISQRKIKHIRRPATFPEIERYFRKGYIILVTLNPLVFTNKKGYASHIVLLTHIDSKWVNFHDPGLPPYEGRRVSRKIFQKAWRSPHREMASLIAVRHKNFISKSKT